LRLLVALGLVTLVLRWRRRSLVLLALLSSTVEVLRLLLVLLRLLTNRLLTLRLLAYRLLAYGLLSCPALSLLWSRCLASQLRLKATLTRLCCRLLRLTRRLGLALLFAVWALSFPILRLRRLRFSGRILS
jgi:hypothetical protein